MNELEKASFEQQMSVSMEQNIEMTRELLVMTKKIHRSMKVARFAAIVQFILIVGPIIIGAIFLPSLLKNIGSITTGLPQQLMDFNGAGTNLLPTNELEKAKTLDINSLIKQYQQIQNSNK